MSTIVTLKKKAKRIPFVDSTYRSLRRFYKKSYPAKPEYVFEREEWENYQDDTINVRRARIINVLGYTKTSGSSYSARNYPAGYHEITIDGETFAGQRSPQARLKHIPFDFEGKTLLDIGCNQGGMMFALQGKLKWAIGIDYDHRMINACNLIKSENKVEEFSFYTIDIDRDPHDFISDFLPEKRVDVVFLLAVCIWVKKWREVILFAAKISDVIVFETNGTDSQQDEQIAFLRQIYQQVDLLARTSDDDPKQKRRQLIIAQKRCQGAPGGK